MNKKLLTLKEKTIETLKNCYKKTKIHHVFLFIALIWGMFQIFVMPPLQVPDESGHFFRAWQVTNLTLKCDENLNVDIPLNVTKIHSQFQEGLMHDGLFSFHRNFPLASQKIESEEVKRFTQFCSYNPIGYYPQAIGIGIGRILDISPVHVFYLGRITNFLVAILLIYYSIKIIPFGKFILMFTTFLPMCFHQLASQSGDALTIAAAFFFVAVVIYYSQKKTLSYKHLCIITAVSLLCTQVKPGYATILILLLVLLPRQFGEGKKRFLRYFGFMLIAVALNLLLFFGLTKLSNPDKYLRPAHPVDPSVQVNYIMNEPLTYAGIISYELEKNSENYLKGMAGRLAFLAVEFSDLFYLFLVFILLIFLSSEKEKVPLNLWQRLIILSGFFSVVLFIFTLEYVFWSRPHQDSIEGIQGRYFLANFPLLLLGLYKINFKKYAKIITLIVVFAIIGFLTVRNLYNFFHKPRLIFTPESKTVATDVKTFLDLTDKMPQIEHLGEFQFDSKGSKSYFVLDATRISGISFTVATESQKGEIEIFYLFEGEEDYDRNYRDSLRVSKDVNVNLPLAEQRFDKKITKLRISPTSKNEAVTLQNMKIYSK